MTKKTNHQVAQEGELIEDFPCDVGEDGEQQSNGSVECIYELAGKKYSVICDWDKKPRWPELEATETE